MDKLPDDPSSITRSGQNLLMSVYRTKIADQCRLITVTWCKNMLLHGLSVSVEGSQGGESHYTCKVELKPWYFWKKKGSKCFLVDGKQVHVLWDLRVAKFNGETEPSSDYYVAVVCDNEVVLLLGNLRKEAYRKTRCRPALIDPILVSRKEHIFGKKKFIARVKFQEKGSFHEICIQCKNNISGNNKLVVDPEMEIHIDGSLLVHVKHLQWKFRGNDSIHLNRSKIEVYWDVHDWLFCPGRLRRHASFIFKPTFSGASSPSPLLSSSSPSPSIENNGCAASSDHFCLFLYAWRVE